MGDFRKTFIAFNTLADSDITEIILPPQDGGFYEFHVIRGVINDNVAIKVVVKVNGAAILDFGGAGISGCAEMVFPQGWALESGQRPTIQLITTAGAPPAGDETNLVVMGQFQGEFSYGPGANPGATLAVRKNP